MGEPVDEESGEAGPLDLTPQASRLRRRAGRPLSTVFLLAVVAAVVFVLLRTLGDASLFFYEVDEAVSARAELGTERFRVVGTPQPGLVESHLDGQAVVVFTLCVADVLADVAHLGDPAELFQPGVPVVLQGSWVSGDPPGIENLSAAADDGWYLRTDHMVVKHDNDYRGDAAELESCGVGS
ncbi:MAG TPA: cytochrome c maturation protein CcmE [Acidimicrobiales bacterium]|nr:cytochrome c maturation protein CcmE [Acidimicrobiales bacterium]MDP6280328.1 cytochrome c maturation protein CcmE [Acidimicrobiales bacterium]MDP7117947.1 cytochrome c maturation protein CcmE [Acidimicrobiales bacterium]MDP7410187.1 cytochrome c maturation protein CcmE [Acidimicrobiales bacterium]MEE1521518.1 cytochrome c maturation protein CcmE [Acidimicrobiales bacterium]